MQSITVDWAATPADVVEHWVCTRGAPQPQPSAGGGGGGGPTGGGCGGRPAGDGSGNGGGGGPVGDGNGGSGGPMGSGGDGGLSPDTVAPAAPTERPAATKHTQMGGRPTKFRRVVAVNDVEALANSED